MVDEIESREDSTVGFISTGAEEPMLEEKLPSILEKRRYEIASFHARVVPKKIF